MVLLHPTFEARIAVVEDAVAATFAVLLLPALATNRRPLRLVAATATTNRLFLPFAHTVGLAPGLRLVAVVVALGVGALDEQDPFRIAAVVAAAVAAVAAAPILALVEAAATINLPAK